MEAVRLLQLCDVADPIGLRDRAIIEVLYSTGIRRGEVVALKLYDLSLERGVILVRQGKGKKDRYVPIGERAIAWLQKYVREARPQLSTRTLQQVHAATNPAAHLGHHESAPLKAPHPDAEALFQALAEEAEDDRE